MSQHRRSSVQEKRAAYGQEAWLLSVTEAFGNPVDYMRAAVVFVVEVVGAHVSRAAVGGCRLVARAAVVAATVSTYAGVGLKRRLTFGRDGCNVGSMVGCLCDVQSSSH